MPSISSFSSYSSLPSSSLSSSPSPSSSAFSLPLLPPSFQFTFTMASSPSPSLSLSLPLSNSPSPSPSPSPSTSTSTSATPSLMSSPRTSTKLQLPTPFTPPTFRVSSLLFSVSILFSFGTLLSVLILLLQSQHKVYSALSSSSSLYLSFICGLSAVLIGSIYPLADCWIHGRPQKVEHGWADVLRCITLYLGINYATSKLPLLEGGQLSIILALIAVGHWWLFDRSIHGFVLGLFVALCGTLFVHLFAYSGLYTFANPDFFGIQSWIPVVLFASGICFGTLGRHLEVFESAPVTVRRQKQKIL